MPSLFLGYTVCIHRLVYGWYSIYVRTVCSVMSFSVFYLGYFEISHSFELLSQILRYFLSASRNSGFLSRIGVARVNNYSIFFELIIINSNDLENSIAKRL